MFRKTCVAAIAVFIDDSFLQVYAASFMLTGALIAQAYVSPFTSDVHNNLELLSLVASQVTQVSEAGVTSSRGSVLMPCATWLLQMGSMMYWRFPQHETLITVVLIGVNVVTFAAFVVTIVYKVRYAELFVRMTSLASKVCSMQVPLAQPRSHAIVPCLRPPTGQNTDEFAVRPP